MEVNRGAGSLEFVLVAAGLERGGLRVAAQRRFAGNWQQPRLFTDVTSVLLHKTTEAFDPFEMFTPPDMDKEVRVDVGSVVSGKERWTSLFVAEGEPRVLLFV